MRSALAGLSRQNDEITKKNHHIVGTHTLHIVKLQSGELFDCRVVTTIKQRR